MKNFIFIFFLSLSVKLIGASRKVPIKIEFNHLGSFLVSDLKSSDSYFNCYAANGAGAFIEKLRFIYESPFSRNKSKIINLLKKLETTKQARHALGYTEVLLYGSEETARRNGILEGLIFKHIKKVLGLSLRGYFVEPVFPEGKEELLKARKSETCNDILKFWNTHAKEIIIHVIEVGLNQEHHELVKEIFAKLLEEKNYYEIIEYLDSWAKSAWDEIDLCNRNNEVRFDR